VPATPWVEMTAPETPYLKGVAEDIGVDVFPHLLLEIVGTTVVFYKTLTPHVEMSLPVATSATEMSLPVATTWTKMSL